MLFDILFFLSYSENILTIQEVFTMHMHNEQIEIWLRSFTLSATDFISGRVFYAHSGFLVGLPKWGLMYSSSQDTVRFYLYYCVVGDTIDTIWFDPYPSQRGPVSAGITKKYLSLPCSSFVHISLSDLLFAVKTFAQQVEEFIDTDNRDEYILWEPRFRLRKGVYLDVL